MSVWVFVNVYGPSIGSITSEELAQELATEWPDGIYFFAELTV